MTEYKSLNREDYKKPSDFYNSKSPGHDEMHLWLQGFNLTNIINLIHGNDYKTDVEILSDLREEPIYSEGYSRYAQGVVDAIIIYVLNQDYRTKYKLIIEYKPELHTISRNGQTGYNATGAISQIKIYAHSISDKDFNQKDGTLNLCILTYDMDKKYVNLLKNQGINLVSIK